MSPSHAIMDFSTPYQLPRRIFAHLPLRKRILQRVQQSPDLAKECGLDDSSAAAATPEATSRLTCLVCHKRFASARKHRSHELRHSNKVLGRYRCPTCSKCFVQKSSLVTHVRIHTGERPYRCRRCDASFRDVSCYNKHKLVHSGDRPYVCIACNKTFTQSGNLYRHMRRCDQVANKSPSPS